MLSCRPIAAAWNPVTYEINCRYLSRLQHVHASVELFLDSSIILMLTLMYSQTGVEKSQIRAFDYDLTHLIMANVTVAFKLAILAVGLLALGTLAGRTNCLETNLGAYPPV
jgi:hypothetical protein